MTKSTNGHKPKADWAVPERIVQLVFEDKGIWVRAALDIPLGLLLEYDQSTSSGDPRRAYEIFAAQLVEWNVSLRGEAVPCTADGLLSLPLHTVRMLTDAWTEAIKNPPLVEAASA